MADTPPNSLPEDVKPDFEVYNVPKPPNRFQKMVTHSNPNQPRQIRSRTGNTHDPIPEGKKPASPTLHSGVLKALTQHEEERHKHPEQPKDWPQDVQKQHWQAINRAHGFTPAPDKAMPWHTQPVAGKHDRGVVASSTNMIGDSRRAHHGVYEGRHPRTTFAGSFPASANP